MFCVPLDQRKEEFAGQLEELTGVTSQEALQGNADVEGFDTT